MDSRPLSSGAARGGFSLVEFLMAAFILAVGLLGLGAMQIATTRGMAAAGARQTALGLAEAALEGAQWEARRAFRARCRQPPDAPADPGPAPRQEPFDRDGWPAAERPGFFTLSVTWSAPDPTPLRVVRARVSWPEPGRAGRLELVRTVAD